MAKIDLVIKCYGRVINIPFTNLKNLDSFTSSYDNQKELFNAINVLLSLNIKEKDVNDIYLLNWYKPRNSKDNDNLLFQKLPIKYSQDNYQEEDINKVYAQYYKDNHSRILAYKEGIRYVKHDAIMNYSLSNDILTDRDIDLATASYFKDYSYKKYRDAYFRLKSANYVVKKKKTIKESVNRTNLNSYSSTDTTLDNIIRYGRLGDEEHDKAIEELSLYDLDNRLDSNTYLFDGQEQRNNDLSLAALNLENLTKQSLEELKELVLNYNKKGLRK